MTVTNSTSSSSSCVDVTVGGAENLTIDWTLESASTFSRLASGRTANNKWTGCVNEPFDCAQLRATLVSQSEPVDHPPIQAVWNGIVWAEESTGLENNAVAMAWIGNECHKSYYQICPGHGIKLRPSGPLCG